MVLPLAAFWKAVIFGCLDLVGGIGMESLLGSDTPSWKSLHSKLDKSTYIFCLIVNIPNISDTFHTELFLDRGVCLFLPHFYVLPFHHPNNCSLLQFQFLAPYYIATMLLQGTHWAILSLKCMSKHKIEVARYVIKKKMFVWCISKLRVILNPVEGHIMLLKLSC